MLMSGRPATVARSAQERIAEGTGQQTAAVHIRRPLVHGSYGIPDEAVASHEPLLCTGAAIGGHTPGFQEGSELQGQLAIGADGGGNSAGDDIRGCVCQIVRQRGAIAENGSRLHLPRRCPVLHVCQKQGHKVRAP